MFSEKYKKILIMKSFDRKFFAIKILAKLQVEETVCVLRLKTMNYKFSLEHILCNPGVTHSNAVGTEWVTPGLPRMFRSQN